MSITPNSQPFSYSISWEEQPEIAQRRVLDPETQEPIEPAQWEDYETGYTEVLVTTAQGVHHQIHPANSSLFSRAAIAQAARDNLGWPE